MDYWAFAWMNEHKIRSAADIDRVLASPTAFKSLQTAAREADLHTAHKVTLFKNAIVAGRGIGIARIGANANRGVIVSETASLLRRVWHFFDQVILQDLAPVIASNSLAEINREALAGWLESLLLISNVGAGDVCMFMSTEDLCEECGGALGLERVTSRGSSLDELAAIFAADTSISIKRRVGDMRSVRLTSAKYSFDYVVQKEAIWFEDQTKESITRSLLWPMVGQSIDQFGMELFFADIVGLGLGTSSAIEALMLRRASAVRGDPTNEIAFNIEIPYVRGVPLDILYKIRFEESDAFAQYQSKLRSAIKARLQTSGQDDYVSVADDIYRDEIERPVLDLKRRLQRNANLLTTQFSAATVAVALGAIGLLSGDPSLTTAGFGGAFAVGALISGALAAKNELEAKDTFFIFEAGNQPDILE